MQSKEKQKSIVVLDKLPSNMIKEAIIVMQKEYDFENICNKKMKENIVKEAEEVILELIKKAEYEKEKKKVEFLIKKYKISKIINYSFIIITSVLLISLIIL